MCIDGFAQLKNLSAQEAYLSLRRFGGIDYLDELYDIEHTLPFDDTMDTLIVILPKKWRRNSMILYHGSNLEIDSVDLK
jgi:hypothetical protein